MRQTRKDLIIAYKFFNTEQGRLVLSDLRKKATMLTGGINTANGIDTNVLLVEEGRSDVVKYIHKMAGKDPLEERDKFAKGE
jgi:hypothetical protein